MVRSLRSLHESAFLLIVSLLVDQSSATSQPIDRPLPAGAIVQMWHEGQITAVTFSPDGKLLASASTSGTIRLWNPETGKLIRELPGHKDGAYGLSFSPDGSRLASAGADSLLRLWDVITGKELRSYRGHADKAVSVAFAPDGKTLASGSYDGSIRIWDVATGAEMRRLLGHEERVTSVAFHPDGRMLASGGTATTDPVLPNGNISPVDETDYVRLWDVSTGDEVYRFPGRGSSVAFSANGLFLAAAGLNMVLEANEYGSSSICVIDGDTVININSQNLIQVWDMQAGKQVSRLKRRGGAIAVSADGRVLVSARGTEEHLHGGLRGNLLGPMDQGTGIRLWETTKARRILRFASEKVITLAFSPDGTTLASGDEAGWVALWDTSARVRGAFTRANEPTPDQLERWWSDLGAGDVKGGNAVDGLVAAGDTAVALLKEKLKPIPANDVKRIRELIHQLDNKQFATREAATKELANLGVRARPSLEQALKEKPSPERRRRIEELLRVIPTLSRASPDVVRVFRAIQVLEEIGSREARELIEELAARAPLREQAERAKTALRQP